MACPPRPAPTSKRDKWKKLLGNVALNAISAVTDLRSFEIMRVAELQEIVFRSVDEAAAVAKAEGIALDVTEAREVLMKLVDLGRRNRQLEVVDARGHHPAPPH